jgi:hypothetical protein
MGYIIDVIERNDDGSWFAYCYCGWSDHGHPTRDAAERVDEEHRQDRFWSWLLSWMRSDHAPLDELHGRTSAHHGPSHRLELADVASILTYLYPDGADLDDALSRGELIAYRGRQDQEVGSGEVRRVQVRTSENQFCVQSNVIW